MSKFDFPDGITLTLDSAPIIYFLEDHPTFAKRFSSLFDAAYEGRIQIAISSITLSEVVTGPLSDGNEILAAQYQKALCESTNWQVIAVGEEIAMMAARFRIEYKLRLPDAIQIATAVTTNSYALVTHDAKFKQVRSIKIFGLN